MDLTSSLVILLIQSQLYLCQARNTLCNTDDYYQERESDRLRDVPVRRQYVISDQNGQFDQYNDFQQSDSTINYPDHDYSFEIVDEDNNHNPNYPYIVDNENENLQNTRSYFTEPQYSRKTNLQPTNAVFSHGARHLHHSRSKKYYPHTEEIIIVTSPERQNHQYYLRGIKVPLRGRRNNLHRLNPNNNININTNSYSKSDSTPQHLSEDISLSKSQMIDELIDQENNLEKPQPLTDSVSLIEILNNDHSDRQPSKNNNVNIDTNINSERAYLSRRRSLDENKNVNVNANSNIDNNYDDEGAMSPAVRVNARKNSELFGLNRRDIDALRTLERRSRNQNGNINTNSNDAGLIVRQKELLPSPLYTDRNGPYIIVDSPRSFRNTPYRNKNKNNNVNVNVNEIDSQEYY